MKENKLKECINSLHIRVGWGGASLPAGNGWGGASLFLHYLKVAFRNMWKHKSQTLISVLGLAVGFTCFALATLWIRYETTFDSSHKNAKYLYVVFSSGLRHTQTGSSKESVYPLGACLKERFPEIAHTASLTPVFRDDKIEVEGVSVQASIIAVDSSFLQMFDLQVLEGSREFLIPGSNKIAITPEKAGQLFGNKHPVGKTVSLWGRTEYTICAVVSGMPGRSNYSFDFMRPFHPFQVETGRDWLFLDGAHTIIELLPSSNRDDFEKKLFEHEIHNGSVTINNMTIMPLTKLRYKDPEVIREVKFQHVVIFGISGLLVVLCSLFNYLTLFASRFRLRQKEFSLRTICGASGGSLLTMLSIEFLLTLLFALLTGCYLTHSVHRPFLDLSFISMDLPAIYKESLAYIGGLILLSLLLFWVLLLLFQQRSLNLSIRQDNKKVFRKLSVITQIVISIGFAFSAIVILKQLYYLKNANEQGFSFKNRGSVVTMGKNSDVVTNLLKQLPGFTEVIDASVTSGLLPASGRSSEEVRVWEDQPADVGALSFEKMEVIPEYTTFYDLRLITGEMLTEADPESMVLLNETAVKALGWHDPVGKKLEMGSRKFTVKGVIKNIHNFAPTLSAKPVCYHKISPTLKAYRLDNPYNNNPRYVLFKYQEDMWAACKEKLEQMREEYRITLIYNDEEIYNSYLKSERALIMLLSIVSVICVLICIFGFVSLVSLTCEERRKSIAIRKINGATVGDILAMFTKEYALLLLIGAAIAFPAGFLIMQRWLEQYVKQTSISTWIYLSILCMLALLIVLCVGWQVYKTSIENPAEVVKGE